MHCQATLMPSAVPRRRQATFGLRSCTITTVAEPRSVFFCKPGRSLLYARAALLQPPQQRFELALLARYVESGGARSVEERDAEHHRREGLALPSFLAQERLRPGRNVTKVTE